MSDNGRMRAPIHPKAGAAGIGGALVTFLVAVLNSVHGIHVPSDVAVAAGGLVAALGAILAPAGTEATVSPRAPATAATVAPVSAQTPAETGV